VLAEYFGVWWTRDVARWGGTLQQKAPLFDHLVGTREQCRRHVEADGLGCLQVDYELELACAQDRQVGPLLPSRIRPA
jgi:hypothetical protein